MICREMVWNCLPAISAILELLKKRCCICYNVYDYVIYVNTVIYCNQVAVF